MKKSSLHVLWPVFFTLGACGVSDEEKEEIESSVRDDISHELIDLRNRAQGIENEISEIKDQLQNQSEQKAVTSETDDSSKTATTPSREPSFTQEEFDQRVGALCDARGIDCS